MSFSYNNQYSEDWNYKVLTERLDTQFYSASNPQDWDYIIQWKVRENDDQIMNYEDAGNHTWLRRRNYPLYDTDHSEGSDDL